MMDRSSLDDSTAPAKWQISRWRRFRTESGLGLLIVLVIAILIILPMAAVVARGFLPANIDQYRPATLLSLFERPLWMTSLKNSLFLATGSAVIGGLLGAVLALLRHQYRFPGARFIEPCVWLVLILPSFVIAQGWILFASRNGFFYQLSGSNLASEIVFSPWGLVLIMSFKNFPLAYLSISAALQWSMKDLIHAGRLSGATAMRTLYTVRLPLLIPAIISGLLLVFVDTLGDFGLPSALATSYRFPTLPYTIYAAINFSPIRFDLAGILACYLALILFLALSLYFWLLRHTHARFLSSRSQPETQQVSPYPRLCSLVVGIILLIALGIPLLTSLTVSLMENIWNGLHIDNLTLGHYQHLLGFDAPFFDAATHSLTIAAVSALFSTLVAFFAAYMLTFTQSRFNPLIEIVCTLSMAIPGVILGIGFIFVWNSPLATQLHLNIYGSPIILIVATSAAAIPVAVRILLGALSQIPASQLQAAMLQGAGLMRRLRTIVLPLILTAVISATLTSFGSSVFDLAINAILQPPRFRVLPTLISRAFEEGNYSYSTAAVFVAGGITTFIILICNGLLRYHFRTLLSSQRPH
ncbi:iron ABC transporter permease [Pectobacterium cacticida]|uniref:ABC transporter permease n=1 Tax=Pectobacterium cacticida TaxID=69221 RepID=UPI002FF12463